MTKPTSNPTQIYAGLDVTRDHPDVFGDHFFGVYLKNKLDMPFKLSDLEGFFDRFPVVPEAFNAEGKKRYYDMPYNSARGDEQNVVFKGEFHRPQLEQLSESILNQTGGSIATRAVKAFMNSETAFSEVSKKEFAECFIGAIQSPQAAPFVAIMALANCVRGRLDDEASLELAQLSNMIWALGNHARPSQFLFSGKEFTAGAWAANPLTADELKALPYVSGMFSEVYEEVGQNHAAHAKSLVEKVATAGFPAASAALAELNGVQLQAKPSSNPTSIYDGLDVNRDHPDVFGDPVFGVYHKRKLEAPFQLMKLDGYFDRYPVERFVVSGTYKDVPHNPRANFDPELVFKGTIDRNHLAEMNEAILNQTMGSSSPRAIASIMKSETAFSEVSKKEFAESFLSAIQAPQAVPFSAVLALSHAVKAGEIVRELGREQASLADMVWALGESHHRNKGFLLSGKEFTTGAWASNPLTADELRALPYVVGVYREVYDEVGQNHAAHAKSLVGKVVAAGFPSAAKFIAELIVVEHSAKKPARRVDLDNGPSM